MLARMQTVSLFESGIPSSCQSPINLACKENTISYRFGQGSGQGLLTKHQVHGTNYSYCVGQQMAL